MIQILDSNSSFNPDTEVFSSFENVTEDKIENDNLGYDYDLNYVLPVKFYLEYHYHTTPH